MSTAITDSGFDNPPPARPGSGFRALPTLSVVITCNGDGEALRRCLDSVLAQDFDAGRYEVVVVDPDDLPALRAVVEARAGSAGSRPALRYVVGSARDGLNAARNRGWKASCGAVLAFIDADAVPGRHWLHHGLAALTPGVAAVQGSVRMALSPAPSDQERELALLAQRGLVGSNCFVSRLALIAVGGYDERFSSAWRGDIDLQFMLIEHFRDRERVRPEPLAEVLIGPRPARWHDGLRRQRWQQFDVLLRAKHPTLYEERLGGLRTDLLNGAQLGAALMLAVAAAAALLANAVLAGTAALLWTMLTAGLALHHYGNRPGLRHHRPRELFGIGLTLIAAPPLAVFWRTVGGLRFHVREPGTV